MQLSNSKYLLPRSLGINRPERTLEDSERIETRYGNIREPHVSPETNKYTLTPELSSPTVQQSRGARPLTPFTTAHLLEAVSKNVKQPQPNTAYKQTKSYIRALVPFLHLLDTAPLEGFGGFGYQYFVPLLRSRHSNTLFTPSPP